VKRTPVLLLPAALQDLDAQAEYIAATQDPQRGALLLQAAAETMELLARYPKMGKVVQVKSRPMAGIRMLRIRRFPNHLVFYLLTKRGVEVHRVLHAARDTDGVSDA
jgi:plasmid stabilization system protein ParE